MSAHLSRLGMVVIGAAVFACALPAVAGATDYCVGQNTSCAPANHRDKFQNALNDAAATPEPDRILLGAETYTAGTVAGYVYNTPTSPVEIVGAGIGQTVLTGQAGVSSILDLTGEAGSAVSDLTIRLPQDAVSGLVTDNVARRIEVDEAPGAQFSGSTTGVYLDNGATLDDSTVTLNSLFSQGVFVDDGHVDRSTVTATTGITINNGSIGRTRVGGDYYGVKAYGGATSIVNSQVFAGEDCGICASPYAGVDTTTVTANGVTVLGAPGAGHGVETDMTYDQAWSVEVDMTNSVIRGFSKALVASAPGTGTGTINISYSDYDPSGNSISGAPNASINAANVTNVGSVGFADPANGDFHLLPGSPLIDAGDPSTAQGLDLDGNSLVTDGNGDGSARRDIGAFESPAVPFAGQPGGHGADTKAPVIAGFRATPALFAIGRASTPRAARAHHGTRFRYTLSEQARVSLKIQRRLRGRYRTVATLTRNGTAGVNRIRFTGRIGKRALRPGRYRGRITAIDTAGNRSAPRTARFRISR